MKTVAAGGEVALKGVGARNGARGFNARRASLGRLWRLKWGLAAAALLLLIVASAVLAPWLAPFDPLAVESIRNQDFPVVQCAVVLLALIIVSVNFIVDMIVGLIDPRIRVGA